MKELKKIIIIDGKKYLVQAPSVRKNKKYDVYYVFNNEDLNDPGLKENQFMKRYLLSYGDIRHQHYKDKWGYYKDLNHNDKTRRERYIKRHSKIGDITNPESAAYWSLNYLW